MSPLFQHKGTPTLFPPGWAEHHRPVAEASMTADGTIHRITAGPAPYPKPPGWTGETLLHSTHFRVQEMNNRSSGAVPGEQPTQERQYLVVAPYGIPALQAGERGDIIRVAGRELRVQQVLYGSQLWEVDIICTDNLTQQNPV